MKRIALVVGLALVLTLAMAAPALAWQSHKPPTPGEAYVFPMSEYYGANVWWEVDADGNSIEHLADVIPIPPDYPIFVCFGWVSPIRGTVVGLPNTDFYAFSLKDAGGNEVWSMSGADAQAKWSVVYNVGTLAAFNKESATGWGRDWYVQLDLDAGSYSGTTVETVRRVITDSSFTDVTWAKHLQQRPIKFRPGQYPTTFAFTVAP